MPSATTTKPRKYKAKPPISQLDDAAAQRRRAQSSKAQRAYRQRKEDTIANLSQQISDLEGVVERLSSCFLGLNDKLLEHLSHESHSVLAESIRDSMREFKSIIETSSDEDGGQTDADGRVNDGRGSDGQTHVPTSSTSRRPSHASHASHASQASRLSNASLASHASPSITHHESPTNWSTSSCEPIQEQPIFTIPPYQFLGFGQSVPLMQVPFNSFSGPPFLGLTNGNLPTPSNHEALAQRLFNTTLRMALYVVQTTDESDPRFRRVFNSYFSIHPPGQVRGAVLEMLQRGSWNDCNKDSKGGEYLSPTEVARFCADQGFTFLPDTDQLVTSRSGFDLADWSPTNSNDYAIIDVNKFIDDIIVGAICQNDAPGYRKDAVARAVVQALG